MKKKVMIVIPTLGGGGAERIIKDLACGIDKDKWDILVISLYDRIYGNADYIDQLERTEHVSVIFLDKKGGVDISLVFSLRREIRRYQPDVIHTHLYACSYVVFADIFSKRKIVHTVHNIAERELPYSHQILMGIFYKFHKVVPVAISKTVLESIKKKYGLRKENIRLIYNGIQISQFDNRKEKKKYDFLTVGRFTSQKNPMLVLSALSEIRKDFPNVRLCMCGEGELRQSMEKKIQTDKLERNVELPGFIRDISVYLKQSVYFVFASDFEGFGLAMVEAMAAGLPVIATKTPAALELMTDGEEGYLVEVNNVEDLVKVMSQCLLRVNDDIYKEQCERARIHAQYFNLERMIHGYEELYEENWKWQRY